jgi:hypothetical protein
VAKRFWADRLGQLNAIKLRPHRRQTGLTARAAFSRALSVRFPPTKLNTLSATLELVEHHRGRARVHRVVPIIPAYGIERAIYVVDTIINPDLIAILDSIFGHGLTCPRD